MYIDNNNYKILFKDDYNFEYIDGNCFECDELMAFNISLLNMKGYNTKYCCSGHIMMNFDNIIDSYITFLPWVDLDTIGLPEGWEFDKHTSDHNTIRYYYTNISDYMNNPYSFYKELSESMYKLYEWINSLPYFNLTCSEEKLKIREFYFNIQNYFYFNNFASKYMQKMNDFSYQSYYDARYIYYNTLLEEIILLIGQGCTLENIINYYNNLIESYSSIKRTPFN